MFQDEDNGVFAAFGRVFVFAEELVDENAHPGADAVAERLGSLTGKIADGLAGANNIQVVEERFRAPNVLSLGFPNGMPSDLIPKLAESQIFVAARLGRMRVSPHVYNDEADLDRFIAAMRQAKL